MNMTNHSTQSKSVWKSQFIEEINQYSCFDCDKFNEVGGINALEFQSINQNSRNSQDRTVGIVNSKQCADCVACTENYTERLYTHYSFST